MSPGVPLGGLHGSGGPHPRPPGVDSDLGGQGPPETAPPDGQPHPKFTVTGVRPVQHAAAPTLAFTMEVEDPSGEEVFMSGLTVGIHLEPSKRSYQEQDKAKLIELFGETHRWQTTAQRMVWTIETVLLPSFTGKTTVEVLVACNYDVELAAAKYFHSVSDGEIPLAFHFNGSVYYAGEEGRLQVIQIPWDTITDFKMPISVWKEMIDSYYPYRGWVPVHRDTLDALTLLKAKRGAPTYDAAIVELLAENTIESGAPKDAKLDLPEGMPQPGEAPPMGGANKEPTASAPLPAGPAGEAEEPAVMPEEPGVDVDG